MKLTIKTLKYIVKNFIYIIPFAVVAGALMAILFDYGAQGEFVGKFFSGNLNDISFYTVMRMLSIINLSSWQYALVSLFVIVVISVVLSMELALVEKHMRIGKRTLNGIWNKINDNLISSLGIIMLYLAIYEFWSVLTGAMMFASISIFSAVPAAQCIFVAAIFIGMLFALLYVVAMLYLWLPCLQITGFSFYDALKYSFQLIASIKFSLILQFAVSLCSWGIILLGTTAVCSIFIHVGAPAYAMAVIVFTALFMTFTVRQEVAYFEADQLERADLKPNYKRND